MKPAVARKPLIRIAVVESDPLRFVGFRALFDSEPDFELVSATLPEITAERNIDLVLLGSRGGTNLFDQMASLKASRPDLKIIVTGAGIEFFPNATSNFLVSNTSVGDNGGNGNQAEKHGGFPSKPDRSWPTNAAMGRLLKLAPRRPAKIEHVSAAIASNRGLYPTATCRNGRTASR